MYLAGHEFGHALEHQAPQLYQKLKAAVLASAGDSEERLTPQELRSRALERRSRKLARKQKPSRSA